MRGIEDPGYGDRLIPLIASTGHQHPPVHEQPCLMAASSNMHVSRKAGYLHAEHAERRDGRDHQHLRRTRYS